MIKRILYLAGMLLLLASNQSYAQGPAVLSLDQAWELGLSQYPGLAENKAQLLAAAYQKQLVKNNFLPQLQTQLQNTYGTYAGSAGAFFPLPGNFNVSGSTAPEGQPLATTGLYGSVLMDWRVFEFGRRSKALQAAGLQEEASKTRYSVAQLAIQANISSLYLDILYNQVNTRWARTNATRMQEVLAMATSLSEAGLKPGADTLFVLSAYRQALAESQHWEGKAKASKIQLTELIAVPADSFRFPVNTYLAAAPAALWRSPVADSSTHPYLRVLQQQVNIAEVHRQLTNRNIFPTLSVLGGLSTRGSGLSADGVSRQWSAGFDNRRNNYLLGLGLSWNINTAYNTRLQSRLAQQQLLARQSRYDVQALKQHTTLRAIAARLGEQQKQLADADQAVAHARQAYQGYVSRYESGLIPLSELLQLQFLLQQAEKSGIEAYRQFWMQVIRQAELSGDFSFLSTQF